MFAHPLRNQDFCKYQNSGRVAQTVERSAVNRKVVGSMPTSPDSSFWHFDKKLIASKTQGQTRQKIHALLVNEFMFS